MHTKVSLASWELNEAIQLIRDIQPMLRLRGYHLGLGGGVLNKGTSLHDLDIYMFPTSNVPTEYPQQLEQALQVFTTRGVDGLHKVFGPTSSGGGGNDAHCYYDLYQGDYQGRQVDVFVVLSKEEILKRHYDNDLERPRETMVRPPMRRRPGWDGTARLAIADEDDLPF